MILKNIRIIWEVLIEEISIELWVQDFQMSPISRNSTRRLTLELPMFQLNVFSAWDPSVGYTGIRGGIKNRRRLVKWEFYTVAVEEIMAYVDVD